MVKGASLGLKQKATGIARVAAVGGHGSVQGHGQFDAAKGEVKGAADVHGVHACALFLGIKGQFIGGNDFGVMSTRQLQGISQVVPMAMGHQDVGDALVPG